MQIQLAKRSGAGSGAVNRSMIVEPISMQSTIRYPLNKLDESNNLEPMTPIAPGVPNVEEIETMKREL